ncbi:uncharacterized protein LOC144435020 isoform X2 [Glandiceps talaboti]
MAQWINKLFVNTSNQITDSNVVRLKFLLTDLIGDRNLERCDKAVDLFFLLKEQGHISERNLELVKELLWLIDENKLIKDKFREDLHDVERKFQTQGKISSYRRLLHHIGNNLKREDIADVIYQFREKLTARVREQKCIWTTFKHLERRLVLSKDPKVLSRDDGLQGVLATIGRNDLARLVEEYSPDRYRAPTYQGLTVPDHQQTPRDYKRTRSDYNQMLQDPKQRQPNYKRTLSDYQQRHQDYQETQRKQTHSNTPQTDGQSIALAVPSISLPATSVPSTTSSPAAVTATSDVAASVPEPSVSPTPVPLTSMEIASPIIETASPVKIHLPQTAVSPSSQVVPSNPTEESTAPAPVLQWTSSHLGHRLETFNYDQISEMACDFKNVICTEGGFGDVFKGKIKLKCGLDYTVAVKRLKLTQLFGSQGEKHFDRERSVAKVRHPYIMPVIGICEQESKPMCIVYPYMSGGDLKQAIDSKDPRLTWQRRLAIVHQVSSALIYLHKETPNKPTILHLDVKPGNILLDDNFNARLGDVGLSKELDIGKSYASVTACHPGTPGYQDPAMFDEWKQRPYNDLFSLGIVMLCLLTCMPAFLETERKPLHIELRNKRCFKDCMKLLEEANKDVWPVEDEVEKIFSINFADLICQCVKKNPFKRIEWEKFNNEIKKITVDAECRIYNEPTGDDLCAMCSVQPRVRGLALKSHYCDSSCDKICLQCLIDSDKNPLVCPSHGDAEPPIGHSDSFAIFIGTKDSDADFHPDAKGLYKVFTHPEIGAIRKENAILMTSKQVSDELKPTSKNILAQLSIMEERMRGAHEASLIFHFSGHGGRQGEILVCGSDDFLQASELKLKLHTMNFTQLLIILDCCYAAKNGPLPSGFFVNSPSSIVTKGDNDLATDCDDEELCSAIPNLCKLTESDDVIEKASPSPTTSANYSIVQWSASKGPETALGYKTGKSVFTTHVQEGLHAARKCRLKNSTENSKCAKCCSYRDEMKRQSYITFNELTDYVYHHVTKEVAEHRKEQHPQTVAEENTRRRIIAYCKAENQ